MLLVSISYLYKNLKLRQKFTDKYELMNTDSVKLHLVKSNNYTWPLIKTVLLLNGISTQLIRS